jgi:PAS domain-containing protein
LSPSAGKSPVRGIAILLRPVEDPAVPFTLPTPFRPRRRSRQRLRDDQDLLDAVLASVGVAVVACGVDGRLTYANSPARDLLRGACWLGVAPHSWTDELRPRTPSGMPLAREDLPPVRALDGETVRGVDVRVTIGDHDALLCVTATPVNDEKGRRRGAVLTLADVTEERAAEARRRARGLS